jgi:hypothetical protein
MMNDFGDISMLRSATITGIQKLAKTNKKCHCGLAEEIVKFVGQSGDKSDWVEMIGDRIRIRSSEQEVCIQMRFTTISLFVLPWIVGCQSSRHSTMPKPIEVSVTATYQSKDSCVAITVKK